MTMTTKLDARARLAQAEAAVARWLKSIEKARGEADRAAAAGFVTRQASVLDRIDRLTARLEAAEVRRDRLRERLPQALHREKAAQSAVRAGVKLAGRVAAAAPQVRARWKDERKAEREARIKRERKGLKHEGHDGKVQRATKTVPDPYDGTPLRVVINAYESPLEHMRTRKKIDGSQFAAGERFRAIYERASIGAVGAIDYGKPQVDGGKLPETLSETVATAARELAGLKGVVGAVCYRYLEAVVGERVALKEMARHYGKLAGERAEGFVSGQVVSGLDRLVEHWGMTSRGKPVCERHVVSTFGAAGERWRRAKAGAA